MKNPLQDNINAVARAFKLIELLVTKPQFGIGELSRLLKFPKTTVYRLLVTLEALGYVRKNPLSLTYTVTLKFFEIGSSALENLSITNVAHSLMIELSERTGETVNLGVLDGLDIVCIDKVESKHTLKQDQPIGSRYKAYCTAFGKAALAYIPREERDTLLSKEIIRPIGSKALKSIDEIKENLRLVVEKGFSTDNEESQSGIRCVGAPIFDYNGKVIAGISVAGPALRIKENDFQHLGVTVLRVAKTISKQLGANVGALPY